MTSPDVHTLQRFVEAQQDDYAQALAELRSGSKQSHWIWYVLPQLRGLGLSGRSQHYGLSGLDEAAAYAAHPLLGPRLVECVQAMLAHPGLSAEQILGKIDALKFHSCLTLFAEAAPGEPCFHQALQRFYASRPDAATMRLLAWRPKPAARPGPRKDPR
jgi:uncharacterized protein (DUF1810 family)